MATRSMSIYLLKQGIGVEDALRDDRPYREVTPRRQDVAGLRVFLKAGAPNAPWWKDYLGVDEDVFQQSSSATAFLSHGKRFFVLTFGAGQHLLREDAYVHDFGTRVVLNAVDPKKLKSADTLDPDSSQRRRTQIPFDGDLALLSFTGDSSVLKSLTGKAKAEHNDLVRSVTGSASLRITTPAEPESLGVLLERLLQLYKSKQYRKTFPDIAQIRPITDPDSIEPLNAQLVAAVFDVSAPLVLTVPDILDYADESFVRFAGRGGSEVFDDVYIKHYREYLEDKGISSDDLSIDGLKHDDLVLLNGDLEITRRWSIFRSLVFEVDASDGYSYHLSDGTWYRVATSLTNSLRDFLDPYWIDANLPPHEWATEGEYNIEASNAVDGICLDKSNISPRGQTAVEPCDLLRLWDGGVEFVHVKVGTSSATLSHLFNQAANSAQLLQTTDSSIDKLRKLVLKRSDKATASRVAESVAGQAYSVAIAIVSHKRTPELKSDNLPIFSRISLRRALTALRAMRVPTTVQLVPDATDRAGRKKPRKPRQSPS